MSGCLNLKYAHEIRPGDVVMWSAYPADVLDVVHRGAWVDLVIAPSEPPLTVATYCAMSVVGRMPC